MSISVTKLCRLGILTNNGNIVGYDLNKSECIHVIRRLRDILSIMTAKEYLRITIFPKLFPENIVYMIIRDNKEPLDKII